MYPSSRTACLQHKCTIVAPAVFILTAAMRQTATDEVHAHLLWQQTREAEHNTLLGTNAVMRNVNQTV